MLICLLDSKCDFITKSNKQSRKLKGRQLTCLTYQHILPITQIHRPWYWHSYSKRERSHLEHLVGGNQFQFVVFKLLLYFYTLLLDTDLNGFSKSVILFLLLTVWPLRILHWRVCVRCNGNMSSNQHWTYCVTLSDHVHIHKRHEPRFCSVDVFHRWDRATGCRHRSIG